MKEMQVDVVIIGAGHAGLNALKEVRKVTDNYVLINGGGLGTTCARYGCMPSKVAIQLAESYHDRENLKKWGIEGTDHIKIDETRMMDHVRDMRDMFVDLILANTTDEMGEELIEGYARFANPNLIEVNDLRIHTQATVVATGSRSAIPPFWQEYANEFLYAENLFEMETFPESVAVIGLGPIGIEMGQALHRLGVEVTGFEAGNNIARISDPVINKTAIDIISREFPLHVGAPASIEQQGGQFKVSAGEHSVLVEKVLLSVGRTPNMDKTGVFDLLDDSIDPHSLPINPHTMQLAGLPIYIAGDANGKSATLQVAADEGRIAGINASRKHPIAVKPKTHMGIVFSEPNITSVGMTWDEIDIESCIIGQHRFGPTGRAIIMGKNRGEMRVYADKESGIVLGASLVGPRCEHLAHLLSWSIQQKMTVVDMLRMPYYHPVIEEALQDTLQGMARKMSINEELSCEFEVMGARLREVPPRPTHPALRKAWYQRGVGAN